MTDVLISMYAQDEVKVGSARPASVGSVIGLKPEISVVLPWPHQDFDHLWTLALSGRLGFAHLIFSAPHYNRAAVISASLSTEREE